MSRARALAVVLLTVLAGALVVALLRVDGSPPPRPPAAARPDPTAAEALGALHAWDGRRAEAYARGSPGRLRSLYVPGAAAGEADVRLLRRYADRGWRVRGMRTQVLALRVTTRRSGALGLVVTDRLASAVAVRERHRVRLPRDGSSTREVRLMRGPDRRWRVAGVSGEVGGEVSGEVR